MAENTPNDQSSENVNSPVKVKKEKTDEDNHTSSSDIVNFAVSHELSQLRARDVTVTVNDSSSTNNYRNYSYSSSTVERQTLPEEIVIPPQPLKTDPPPIDIASIRGSFGWTTVGEVHLPLILRGEDQFIAVRMVESKIIGAYVDILPWTVFACTNIKSYYITPHEAKLLNEINDFHCDNYYGYITFTTKDVVVRLCDTVKLYEYLEACRTKLHPDCNNPQFKDHCGFVIVNFKAIPYVKKGKKKYILYNMVYQEGVSAPVSCTETVCEWDITYFRFLNSVTAVDQRYVRVGATLCSLEDLQQALGMAELEEWWPTIQYPSKSGRSLFSSDYTMPKYGDSLSFLPPDFAEKENSAKFGDMKEFQAKSMVNPFQDVDWLSAKPSSVNQHDTSSDSRSHLFPTSLESLLSTPQQPINYQLQYASQIQSSVMPNITQHLSSEGGLSSLATSRPRPFPPPPPLVRLEHSPRSTTVPIVDHRTFSKTSSSIYPYMHPAVTSSGYPPWITNMLEPEWFQKNDRRSAIAHQSSELANAPQSHSHIISSEDHWASVSSGVSVPSSTSSSSYARSYNLPRGLRESYDPSYSALSRDDRLASFHRGSPRPATGAGPPPHYPTPPQSSPLQSLMECSPIPGLPDLYGMRATPFEICSPPPSPERTSLPTSPRGNYGVSTSYQPHTVRVAQVDTRYMLAINVEPHKHTSPLAVPISEVVSKFLRGTSVESCQVALETLFGVQLYESTNLHQEAYAKQNVSVVPGSKLVSVTDLRNYLCQLRFVLAEREKQKERSYDFHAATEEDQPLAKRWRGKE